jgi:hypothetical protein
MAARTKITATSTTPVVGDQTIDIEISGTNINPGDYALSDTQIIIFNGETEGHAFLTAVYDLVFEDTDTLHVALVNPSAGLSIGETAETDILLLDNYYWTGMFTPFIYIEPSPRRANMLEETVVTLNVVRRHGSYGSPEMVNLTVTSVSGTASGFTLADSTLTLDDFTGLASTTLTIHSNFLPSKGDILIVTMTATDLDAMPWTYIDNVDTAYIIVSQTPR